MGGFCWGIERHAEGHASRTRLIAFQMATSVVLLVLAALFARSVFAAQRAFRPRSGEHRRRPSGLSNAKDCERTGLTPSIACSMPRAFRAASSRRFRAACPAVPQAIGRPWPLSAPHSVRARSLTISPAFFRVIGEPIISGREFSTEDAAGGQNAAILNDVAADDLWPDHTAVGRQVPGSRSSAADGRRVVRSTGTSAGDRPYRRFVVPLLSQNPVFGASSCSGPPRRTVACADDEGCCCRGVTRTCAL